MVNQHRQRKRNRLSEWDYSTPHWYFVTICTQNHHELLGEIVKGEMVLNENGEIAEYTWFDLPNHNPNIKLDEFILMPNHIHGIIIIKNMIDYTVGTDSKSVLISESDTKRTGSEPVNVNKNTINRTGSEPVPTKKNHGLPEIVRQFKTFSARRINKNRNTPGQQVWQRSYYDHIIRNENSLGNIKLYIRENPQSWETDKNNPENIKC